MRAPPLLLLLLMAAAGLAVSPLARLNPWLSACDLEEEGASGVPECGGAACGGGGGAAEVLAARDVPHLCRLAAGARAHRLTELRLRACCERSPASALDRSARADVLAGGDRCERTLHDLLRLDTMVAHVHCDFVNILHRYDCDQAYSVHTCDECQVSRSCITGTLRVLLSLHSTDCFRDECYSYKYLVLSYVLRLYTRSRTKS